MWLLLALTITLDSLFVPKVVNKPFPHRYDRDTTTNYIVVHYDSSSTPSTTFRWLYKKRNSYNYYIDRRGVVYKLVDPKWEAGHAGLSFYDGHMRMNRYSIGICFQSDGKQPFTSRQYQAGAWLVSIIHRRFPDSKDKPILGHSDIAWPRGRKKDPGPNFEWDTFKKYVVIYDAIRFPQKRKSTISRSG